MPGSKDQFFRYKVLDELLGSQYHNYSLDDLTREVSDRLCEIHPESDGVTRRCIEKDIHYLEYESPWSDDMEIERYNVDVTDPNTGDVRVKHCLRYSDPSYSIFKKRLTDDEELLLGEALKLLGQFDGLPGLEGLESLRVSLKTPSSEHSIISFTRNPLEDKNVLGQLFTTISNRQVVEITYAKFGLEGKAPSYVLYPYLLKEYNRRWFLIAASAADGKLLTFALDRINQVTPLPAQPYVDYDGDINKRFDDIIGVTVLNDEPVQRIVFWANDVEMNYIATKPLHGTQHTICGDKEQALRDEYPGLTGGAFFYIECKRNYELTRELCSHGDGLIVLSPSNIQKEVVDRINTMAAAYEKLK